MSTNKREDEDLLNDDEPASSAPTAELSEPLDDEPLFAASDSDEECAPKERPATLIKWAATGEKLRTYGLPVGMWAFTPSPDGAYLHASK